MTRFLFSILVVLILWSPTSSIADTLNSIHIEENDKGITIRVDDVPLGEVAKSIEGKTGIRFHVSSSVLNDLITVNLNAPDWQTAMSLLLEPYGRAELWNPRLDLTEIHVLSRADDTESSLSGAGPPPKLNRRKLLKLASGALTAPLPPKLLNDPEVRAFLNYYGIHSREDMKDIKKARSVRIKARRIMLQMSDAQKN